MVSRLLRPQGRPLRCRRAQSGSRAALPLSLVRRTCSRLPLCIGPRRWYDWALQQQQVLQLLIAGASLRRTAAIFALGYHTVRRWWRSLSARHETFVFHLRSRFAELGRSADRGGFWLACFRCRPLCEAMAWLDHDGLAVP